jgi:chromosome segregation and condensation protein ScpB
MGRRAQAKQGLDTELAELRWREWMGRVEAVIFASPKPVPREVLARVVGRDCNLDRIIDDIRDELRGRPYELVAVAGGWQHRTRKNFADAIRLATGLGAETKQLSDFENLILLCVAYFQPITRGELGRFFGKEVSRDTIGHLRALGFIAAGPRSPPPARPTPMSPRRASCRTLASTPCAICPTWRRSTTRACSARTSCSPATYPCLPRTRTSPTTRLARAMRLRSWTKGSQDRPKSRPRARLNIV